MKILCCHEGRFLNWIFMLFPGCRLNSYGVLSCSLKGDWFLFHFRVSERKMFLVGIHSDARRRYPSSIYFDIRVQLGCVVMKKNIPSPWYFQAKLQRRQSVVNTFHLFCCCPILFGSMFIFQSFQCYWSFSSGHFLSFFYS